MTDRTCTIVEDDGQCPTAHYALGMCMKHWARNRKTGSPYPREAPPPRPAEPDLPGETWRPVPGWTGLYEVSDMGRVRSLPRKTVSGWRGGKMLKQTVNPDGYYVVGLSRPGVRSNDVRRVHQLVAEAFIGPQLPGMDVCHGPRGPLCNELTNLRYGTRKENTADAMAAGTHAGAVNASKDRCSICGSEYRQRPEGGKAKGRYCPDVNYHYRPRKRDIRD